MKKTWGIILLVIAGLGLLGAVANGSAFSTEVPSIIGSWVIPAVCVFFGIKLIKKG